jgi:predicted nucleotidyltransferase
MKLSGLSEQETAQIIPQNTILLGFVGSIAHGTYVPKNDPNCIDDKDILGICIANEQTYFGLGTFEQKEVKQGEWDSVVYEIRKAFRLLLKQNPNIIGLLWLQEKDYVHISDSGRLLLENRNLFASKEAYHSFIGYAHGQLHRMTHGAFEGYMGAKRKELVDRFGFDCYLEKETEFLTEKGWLKFDQINNKTKLATVEFSTGELFFELPLKKTDKLYSGSMYRFEPHMSRFTITQDHKLLVSPCHRSRKIGFSTKYDKNNSCWFLGSYSYLKELNRSNYHIRRAVEDRKKELAISDNYLKLAGLFLSDGTLQFRNNKKGKKTLKSLRLSQVKNGNFVKTVEELKKVYNLKEYKYNKETIWILHGKIAQKIYKEFGHSRNKHLPRWTFRLSARQANILFEACLDGDGTRKEKNRSILYTSVYKLGSDIHAMLTSAGILASMHGPYIFNTSFGVSSLYQIYRPEQSSKISTLDIKNVLRKNVYQNKREGFVVKELEVTNARVVCFGMSKHTLVTRNQGNIAIQGNCKNAAHLIRILRMGIEFLTDGILRVYRNDNHELKDIKSGKWTLEQVKVEADKLFASAREAYIRSPLPSLPDRERAEKLLVNILKTHLLSSNSI